jgi:short-subunit dehydrogenase
VHVTTVCPSYVATGLFDGAKPPLLTTMLTPDRLADMVARAVLRNKSKVLAPWLVKLTPPLKGILPAGMFNAVSGFLGATSSMTQWKGRG